MADLPQQRGDPIYRGQVAVIRFTFPEGTDITGRQFRCTIADKPAGTRLYTLTMASGVTIFNARTVQATLNDAQTWALAVTGLTDGVAVDLWDVESGSFKPVAKAIIPVLEWAYERA